VRCEAKLIEDQSAPLRRISKLLRALLLLVALFWPCSIGGHSQADVMTARVHPLFPYGSVFA
jgi:hypothetical protein